MGALVGVDAYVYVSFFTTLKLLVTIKALTQCRTDNTSNILADRGEFSAGCYLFAVLNSCLLSAASAFAEFFSRDCKRLPATLTFKHKLDSVKLNQHAKYLGQRSFRSKVIVWTHTGPLKRSITR